jgi:hypothetical protein
MNRPESPTGWTAGVHYVGSLWGVGMLTTCRTVLQEELSEIFLAFLKDESRTVTPLPPPLLFDPHKVHASRYVGALLGFTHCIKCLKLCRRSNRTQCSTWAACCPIFHGTAGTRRCGICHRSLYKTGMCLCPSNLEKYVFAKRRRCSMAFGS